ncbi:MAG: Sec-independent protein translocase protein TatB [Tranquillimonas sp.]|jgi:sec-independent protein translocase protein TatB
MFDIGWTELLLIGIVALIVVGPKDLPGMFHQLGRITARMKGMAREFQRAMDDAARDSGVNDVAKDLREATSARSMGLDKLKDAADRFEKWEPGKQPKGKSPAAPDEEAEAGGLSADRAEAAQKVRDATAKAAADRKAAQAAAGPAAETPPASPVEPAPKGDA